MWEAHNWRRFDRLWLGMFTLLPVLAGLAILGNVLLRPDRGTLVEGSGPCILCLALPLMIFLLMLVYLPTLLNNSRLTKGMRNLWFVGFLVAGIVLIPIYWYMHVWHAPYQPDKNTDDQGW